VVLAILLLTAFTFITIDARGGDNSLLDRARQAAGSVLGPVERAAGAVVNPVRDFVDGFSSINSNQDRIDELSAENNRLQQELLNSDLNSAQLDQFNKLMHITAVTNYDLITANVIGVAVPGGYAHTIAIDAGTIDGIKREQTVMSGDGLVGRVIAVTRTTATVLLISDPESKVGARDARSQELGVIAGSGNDPLNFQLFNGQASVDVGDPVLTSGSKGDRPFVPGIPIGEVSHVFATPGELYRQAKVTPYADLTSLTVVGVVVSAPRKDPRDVLVATETPSPTAEPSQSISPQPSDSVSPAPSTSP